MRKLFLLSFCLTLHAAPALVYSAYLRTNFNPRAIATDSLGSIYLAGDVQVDAATRQTTALIVKLSPQADRYLYTRYLGGSIYDSANAIAVDSAGNAFVVGQTGSPDFPVTAGSDFATPATSRNDRRSFVTKLDAAGNVVFSTLLGGSAQSSAQAVALTASGQVLVSGSIQSGTFPSTPGAFTMPAPTAAAYLVKLDPAGKSLIFAATGIGGNSIALDSAGNIYVAGATFRLDYPTTPGAYQTAFPVTRLCTSPSCMGGFQGANQYVTKVDPTGSQLIYSTALTGPLTSVNSAIAVDDAGNAYVTGYAGAGYPYTVVVPTIPPLPPFEMQGTPFVSKLDPAGRTLLFSIPAGGGGLSLRTGGALYAGGQFGFVRPEQQAYTLPFTPPSLENVPPQCLPNRRTIRTAAYVTELDASTGSIAATQFVGGAALKVAGVQFFGSKIWLAGTTDGPHVPLIPSTFPPPYLVPETGLSLGTGAYLGAVDFGQPASPAGTPQVACVLDGADLSPVSVAARLQLLSIFGTNLGPEVGVGAGGSGFELGGTRVVFGATPATLLYVSANQINFAVPAIPGPGDTSPFEVTYNGRSSTPPRQLWFTYRNPHFFVNSDFDANGIPSLVKLNPDGSKNSITNPASAGSIVSVFINGMVPNPNVNTASIRMFARGNWRIRDLKLATPFVTQVDVEVPPIAVGASNAISCPDATPGSVCSISLELFFDDGSPVSPPGGGWIYTRR